MQSHLQLDPTEAAFLFVDAENKPGIVPLDFQLEISEGDKIATNDAGTLMIGHVLWQGENNRCWVCSLTQDGHSWGIRVIRVCDMIAITPLEYSMAIGMSKLHNTLDLPQAEKRLNEANVQVARLNSMGSPKNWCPDCEVPMSVIIEREVFTQLEIVDKTNPERIRLTDPTDLKDKVVAAALYCNGCESKVELDWAKVEMVYD